jgi:hypothetical protein
MPNNFLKGLSMQIVKAKIGEKLFILDKCMSFEISDSTGGEVELIFNVPERIIRVFKEEENEANGVIQGTGSIPTG